METTRFETFFDAIIAIIITVLVLKIPQPTSATPEALLQLNPIFISYLISFLILYNIWYANHNLFQHIETMFGLLFIVTHILNTLATRAIYRSNPYNEQLKKLNFNSYYMNAPTIVLILGFILTYTIYIPGIYVCCLLSVVLWIIIGRLLRRRSHGN